MSSKFKVGDRVKYKDRTGVITNIRKHSYDVSLDGLNSCYQYLLESELELVKEEPKMRDYTVGVDPGAYGGDKSYQREMKEWPCEHIKRAYDDKLWVLGEINCGNVGQKGAWSVCPICEAKRPEPKEETLEDVIEKAYGITPSSHEISIMLAKAIREHLKVALTALIWGRRLRNEMEAVDLAKQILKVLGVE